MEQTSGALPGLAQEYHEQSPQPTRYTGAKLPKATPFVKEKIQYITFSGSAVQMSQ